MKTLLLAATLLLSSTLAFAGGQHVIPDYATAQRSFFWTKLYVNGGRDLYCNVRFTAGQRLTVEHVYAADWIAYHFGCPNREVREALDLRSGLTRPHIRPDWLIPQFRHHLDSCCRLEEP